MVFIGSVISIQKAVIAIIQKTTDNIAIFEADSNIFISLY